MYLDFRKLHLIYQFTFYGTRATGEKTPPQDSATAYSGSSYGKM